MTSVQIVPFASLGLGLCLAFISLALNRRERKKLKRDGVITSQVTYLHVGQYFLIGLVLAAIGFALGSAFMTVFFSCR